MPTCKMEYIDKAVLYPQIEGTYSQVYEPVQSFINTVLSTSNNT